MLFWLILGNSIACQYEILIFRHIFAGDNSTIEDRYPNWRRFIFDGRDDGTDDSEVRKPLI
jgi:hypothetical protein